METFSTIITPISSIVTIFSIVYFLCVVRYALYNMDISPRQIDFCIFLGVLSTLLSTLAIIVNLIEL